MAVDLSRIGIDGIESAHKVFESQARVQTMQSNVLNDAVARDKEQFELMQKQKLDLLSNVASASLAEIAKGNSPMIPGGDSSVDLDSLATPLEVTGEIFIRGGAPAAGMEYLKTASEIRKREDEIKSSAITRQTNRLDQTIKLADFASRTLGVAANQQEWDKALNQVEASGLFPEETVTQLKSIGYDPDVVSFINEQALTASQRAELDMKAQDKERNQADSKSLRDYRDRLTKISQLKLDEDIRHNQRMESVGKSAGVPDAQAVESARTAIVSQIYNGEAPDKDDPIVKAGAFSIAARTQELVRASKSLDWNTAMQRAIEESKQAGEWEGVKPGLSFLGIKLTKDEPAPTFKSRGKSPESAIPLPMAAGKVDTTKLVKGRFYIINGKPKQFTGE